MEKITEQAILIPIKGSNIFPNMVFSLFIEKEELKNAILSLEKSSKIILSAQKDEKQQEILTLEDIYSIGILANISQIIHMKDGVIKVVINSLAKVEIKEIKEEEFLTCSYSIITSKTKYTNDHLEELKQEVLNNFNIFITKTKKFPNSLYLSLSKMNDLEDILHSIVSHLNIPLQEKQNILEMEDILEKTAHINSLLEVEVNLLEVEKKIRDQVKSQMERNQKDYYLNEQVKAIQKELNQGNEIKDEIKELRKKAKKTNLSKDTLEKVETEITKLSLMNPISAEASVVRNYIEWVLGIPWKNYKTNNLDLKKAEKYLEEEHYALSKVKERIIEYLAVLKKSSLIKSPILCLLGPPGVGKTSLAKSIAKASGREFTRISLGGVRDEAEIRGHRRTYIGAMPGKIIQAMKKVKVSNPLILLDEIDKMGSDFRGDPSSALLEVLDKEQNHNFVDHYIEVGYDLSDVMFITTANSLNIQEALIDRMEVIELTGYSEEEKLEIVKRHILNRKMEEASLDNKEFKISNEAILELIRGYTRESGVRELDRVIASVARKAVRKLISKELKTVNVGKNNLVDFAGVRKYQNSEAEEKDLIGITTGLAWTRVGGDILHIEALKLPGKGDVKITGKIGEVMQESVKAAYSLIYANHKELNIDKKQFTDFDIHIHVPEGATPKDGPSAGVAMVTSIFSVLTASYIRKDVAMTGEVTLRGKILPIGGVREKLLAALRAGITNVIIPKDNEKDLIDLPKEALKQLNINLVENFKEVLDIIIKKPKKLSVKKETQKESKKQAKK